MNRRMSSKGSSDEPELQLSPSETVAHNAAMRVSGAAKGDPQAKTERALASITLGFELIIVVLIGLAIFGLSLLEPRELGLWLAGGLALGCVLALALMRFGRIGIALGWVVHAALLATAFLLPAAGFVAVLFTALWVFCLFKGRQIDRDRAAYMQAQAS